MELTSELDPKIMEGDGIGLGPRGRGAKRGERENKGRITLNVVPLSCPSTKELFSDPCPDMFATNWYASSKG